MTNLLAQKMREGIAVSKPIKGKWVAHTDEGLCACALGAVIIACGIDWNKSLEHPLESVQKCTGIDMMQDVVTPDGASHSLWGGITHLNDYTDTTREQIADWVETLDL